MEILDEPDRRLAAALHIAPRATWDELAAVLGVDASTVSRRFARLVRSGILRIVGETDWGLFSSTLPVHLRLQTGSASPAQVLEKLADFPEVQRLALTSGTHPIFATVHAASEPATAELLSRIHDLPGVAAVTSLPVLDYSGKGSGWVPDVLDEAQRSRCVELAAAAEAPDAGRGRPEGTERQAVELLRADPRLAASRLAKPLGVARSTAQRILHRVFEQGWLRARVEIDGSHLGYATPFVLRVKTEPSAALQVRRVLGAHPSTRFVTQVASEHNVLCNGLARSRTHLAELINNDFAAVAGVRELDADLFLAETKRYWIPRGASGTLGEFAPPPLL
ncbi:AsnC family protein [Arthrobacter saudimassiliensis]|uniref:AsnC family protein n=1 Tax=Arthrobacter saudimassiliensis TaxID=1461584 RepID=A0A078MRE0_9MICC|nr:AsnC family protein [Arthrobacter saudimassiliensis]